MGDTCGASLRRRRRWSRRTCLEYWIRIKAWLRFSIECERAEEVDAGPAFACELLVDRSAHRAPNGREMFVRDAGFGHYRLPGGHLKEGAGWDDDVANLSESILYSGGACARHCRQ